ncbi:hypothetical protein [Streptomyces sp. NPDC001389]|uniref:hypothetical protein n=1 Tax=unclassified Streptomyces TaxID=2593676 RepID=UPI003697F582
MTQRSTRLTQVGPRAPLFDAIVEVRHADRISILLHTAAELTKLARAEYPPGALATGIDTPGLLGFR